MKNFLQYFIKIFLFDSVFTGRLHRCALITSIICFWWMQSLSDLPENLQGAFGDSVRSPMGWWFWAPLFYYHRGSAGGHSLPVVELGVEGQIMVGAIFTTW